MLNNLSATLIGCGGVGQRTAELLAKEPNISRVVLYDPDRLSNENTANQVVDDAVGEYKAKVVAERMHRNSLAEREIVAIYGAYTGQQITSDMVFIAADRLEPRHDVLSVVEALEPALRPMLCLDLCLDYEDPDWCSVEVVWCDRYPKYLDLYRQRLAVKSEPVGESVEGTKKRRHNMPACFMLAGMALGMVRSYMNRDSLPTFWDYSVRPFTE